MKKGNELIEAYPASAIQQQFWIVNQLDPGSSAHNIPSVFRIKGVLDISVLKKSVLELVRQHGILRTSFSVDSGTLLQIIDQQSELDIPVLNISENKLFNEQDYLDSYIRKEIVRPFDLHRGPLIRAQIFKINHDDFYFVFIMHHSITDLHSKNIIGKELSFKYNELKKGRPLSFLEPNSDYGEYAVRHAAWLESDDCRRMLAYWTAKLAGVEDHISLPLDYPRPSVQSLKGGAVPFHLDKTQTDILKKLSRDYNVTIYLLLLTTYLIVLYRYSNQSNIAVGIPFTNRREEQSKNVLGCFTSILPITVTFSEETVFSDLLKQVRRTMLEAHKNQETPFKTIIEPLRLKKDPACNPIFQVGFTFENPMSLTLDGLEAVSIPVHCGGSQLDLFPILWDSIEGIRGHIEYCTDLFEKQTIERFADHFRVLLNEVVNKNPHPVSMWNMLGSAEKDLILNIWNSTCKVYPEEKGIHCYFEKQVQKTPNAVALKYNGNSWTYNELNRRANCLAHWLMDHGLRPGANVGIFMERSLEMVVSIYGIVKAGGAYVPIDPDLPDDRIVYMMKDTNVTFVMTQQKFAERLPSINQKNLFIDSDWSEIEKHNEEDPVDRTKPNDPAYIIYTSGSTGRPKGVINTHKGICNRILWMQDEYKLTENDAVLHKTPYSFDVSVWEFFWPLLFGSSLVIASPGVHKDPAKLIKTINENNVTTLHFVPSMLNAFLENPEVRTCRSITKVICSGEALTSSLQKKFFASMGAELHNLYGPTEAAVDVTSWKCIADDNRPIVPIGKPVANTTMFILDKYMQPVPVGISGEIHIGGVQVASGYLNLPELTNEKFVSDPFSTESDAKLYKTGDLGRFLPDGNIEYIGRNDSQVKIRGFRVELGEIESNICMHPGIAQAAVIKKDFSLDDSRLIAYILPDINKAYTVKKNQELLNKNEKTDYKTVELPNGMIVFSMNENVTQFMYREIFEENSYIQNGISLNEGACIFDVGANIGLFSIYAAAHVKKAKIYSFEPLLPIYDVLKQNVGLYNYNIKTYPFGLSDKEENARFTFYPNNSIISSRYADIEEDKNVVRANLLSGMYNDQFNPDMIEELLSERLKSENHKCQLRTLSDFIHQENINTIDLLKIDVEKAENDVLAGIRESDWSKIGQLCIEVHDSTGKMESMNRLLESKGYDVVSVQSEEAGLHMIYAVHSSYPSSNTKYISSDSDTVWYSQKRLIDDVKKHLMVNLPDYMIPSNFIILSEMPLTSSGKIDRKSLPESVLKFSPFEGEYIAPKNEAEKTMADLWAEVLKLEKVSVEDNFFDLGGTSLLSIYLISEIYSRFGHTVSVVTFFQYPTVRSLSSHIHSDGDTIELLNENSRKRAGLRKQSMGRKKMYSNNK